MRSLLLALGMVGALGLVGCTGDRDEGVVGEGVGAIEQGVGEVGQEVGIGDNEEGIVRDDSGVIEGGEERAPASVLSAERCRGITETDVLFTQCRDAGFMEE